VVVVVAVIMARGTERTNPHKPTYKTNPPNQNTNPPSNLDPPKPTHHRCNKQLVAIGIVCYQMFYHPYPSPKRALVVWPEGWRKTGGGGVGVDDQLVAGFNIIFGESALACSGLCAFEQSADGGVKFAS